MHPAPSRRLGALVGATGLLLSLGAGPALAATPTTSATGTPTAAGDVELEGEACPEGDGATVLVDPQDLVGGDLAAPTAGCAQEAPDGLVALTEAGFTATEDGGFVCTIESVPAPDQANCTTDGYWAYYYAPRDGEWTASDVGAAERVPEAGGVEAWSWTELSDDSIEGAPPRVDPAAVEALPVAGAGSTAEPSASPSASAGAAAPEGAGVSEVGAQTEEQASVPVTTIVIIVVVGVLLVLGIVLAANRRRHKVEEEMDERRSDAR